ncbi:MAG: hypothetical protein RMK18_07030 [Armatimonadota bacterium]|nr:hypothetical protein [Armatimonadota bacterium]MDW8025602.1 hypothetical protein [Armatimonadota bacterium]
MSQLQHWWLWLVVALTSGIVGIVTGSPIPICVALGALAATITSIVLPGIAEWAAFFIIACSALAFSSALARKRRYGKMIAANPHSKVSEGENNIASKGTLNGEQQSESENLQSQM